jgi:hypothetical protein
MGRKEDLAGSLENWVIELGTLKLSKKTTTDWGH